MIADGIIIFFFFSSRRRHTRFDCDWSSDVCSSDLRLDPSDVARVAARAQDARVEEDVTARLAAGQEELPLPQAVPEGPGLGRDGIGQRAIEVHAFLSLGGRDGEAARMTSRRVPQPPADREAG